jgi:hypothetical protein
MLDEAAFHERAQLSERAASASGQQIILPDRERSPDCPVGVGHACRRQRTPVTTEGLMA